MAKTKVRPAAAPAVTKTEAVRQALAEIGPEAMPVQIRAFVRAKFGLAMSLNHISNVKTSLARRPPTPDNGTGTGRGSVRLEDVEVAKRLVRRIGTARLHALIDLVAG